MRKIYLVAIVAFSSLLISLNSMAQVSGYTFTPIAGTYTPISGTPITLTEDPINVGLPYDEGFANGIPLGFSFDYLGRAYTTIGVCSNGYAGFGKLTRASFTNNLSTGNTGNPRPILAPLWDDHDLGSSSNLQYLTSGSVGSRVFVIQWSNVLWQWDAAAPVVSFQLRLYESTNIIEFVYDNLGGTPSSPSASIGITATATGSGNYLSLNNASGSPTASSTTNTSTISTVPATGQVYRFTPPSCSPPGVTVTNLTMSGADFSWSALPAASGYEYFVSTSATPPASGTSTAGLSYSASGLVTATQYYFHLRANCAGPFSIWGTTPFKTAIDCSVAEAISACGVSKTVSLTGAGVYSGGDCGFTTPGNEKLYTFTPGVTGLYTLNITAANGSYIDYFYKAASSGCGESGWTCIGDRNAISTIAFGPLNAGITYYILLDAESSAGSTNATFQLDCPAAVPPSCVTNIAPVNGATNVVAPPTLSWNADPVATGYNVFFGTTNPPTTNLGSTPATTVSITGTVAGTTYYWYIQPTNTAGAATGCDVNTTSFTTEPPPPAPANDLVCDAIPLTLDGVQDCQSTAGATSSGDPALPAVCSTPNNTVWYSYTPAVSGTVVLRLQVPGAASNGLEGWVAWYTATGTCPSLTLTAVAGSVCQSFGPTAGDLDDLTSPALTGGTTYYIMVDGVSGDVGDFCIRAITPPTCIAPTGVTVGSITTTTASVSFTGAGTAYIVDYGVSPYTTPGTGAGTGAGGSGVFTGAASPIAMTGLTPSTTYQVYVRQDCGLGSYSTNTGVVTFTTPGPPPANDDATGAITLTLNGACTASPYTNLDATQGATEQFASCYQQNTTAGATRATHTVWYKFVASPTSSVVRVTTDIAGGTLTDTHVALFSATDPADYSTFTTVACDDDNGVIGSTRSILYGSVTPGGTYYVSVDGYNASTGTFCLRVDDLDATMIATTASCAAVEQPSGTQSYTGQVPLVDANGRIVAIVRNPSGGSVADYTGAVNVSASQRSVSGIYYLNRNYLINNSTATNVDVQFFYLSSELASLNAADGATASTLGAARQSGTTCQPNFLSANGVAQFLPQTANGTSPDGTVGWIKVLTPSFSNFFLQKAGLVLPTGLLSFSGEKAGAVNRLHWTTSQEQNNSGFEVQRSTDGITYTAIGFVNSQAVGGNSTSELNYSFIDNSPAGKQQYYRLRQVDIDSRSRLSNIVLIKGAKPTVITIGGLFPNPAGASVNVLVDAPSKDKVTLIVMDATGKSVLQKVVNVDAGSNTVPVDINHLTSGSYLVKLICSSNCESATGKFVKQ